MKFYIGSGFKNAELVNEFSKKLQNYGWQHTYNWAENIKENETIEDLIEYSKLEQKGIEEADAVIIILPAGRGTHIELGMAIALNKKIYLYSSQKEEFDIENTVNFYQIPSIQRIVGDIDYAIKEITK
ncbi:MAG: group-specific protein [Clostridia bacterium]|nr:group-specific protein [Clostridia bacterium]